MPGSSASLTDSELAKELVAVFAAEQAAVARQLELARELDRRTRARIEHLFSTPPTSQAA
jgi:hypothetical protein